MSKMARYTRSAGTAPAVTRVLVDDQQLMRLVDEDDATAFAIVYRRHASAALALAQHMCGRTLGEEVVQEAFLSLWRSAGGYNRTRGSLRGWVLAIVHHRAIDMLRGHTASDRGWVSDDDIAEQLEATERTDHEAGRRATIREVRAVLRRLPPEQSRVIELAYYGGLSNSEIASMLDTPVGTVKGRMRLGLQKLRSELHPEQVLW